jgi:hypothetical protein
MDNYASTDSTAATRQKGRHGGRRPGAGARKGNTNALKTGLYSARLRALLRALQKDPIFIATYRLLMHAAAKKRGTSTRLAAARLLATLDMLSQSNLSATPASENDQDIAQAHARK